VLNLNISASLTVIIDKKQLLLKYVMGIKPHPLLRIARKQHFSPPLALWLAKQSLILLFLPKGLEFSPSDSNRNQGEKQP
jgi:hypothetical protein